MSKANGMARPMPPSEVLAQYQIDESSKTGLSRNGKPIGSLSKCGSYKLVIKGYGAFFVRRLIWALAYGGISENVDVVPRDGDTKNNRLDNLCERPRRPLTPPGRAWCCACKQYKAREEFSSDSTRTTGVNRLCKPCDKLKARPIEQQRDYLARAMNRWPERFAARLALKSAVSRGEVEKWPVCAIPECSNTKVEGHHPDYSQPLSAVWLCSKHHSAAHRIGRRKNHG